MRTQKGFTLVEVVVVVLVIGLLGFIGVRVWGNYTSQQVAQAPTVTTPASIKKINNAQDVKTVESQLDNIDVVGSFDKELDAAATF